MADPKMQKMLSTNSILRLRLGTTTLRYQVRETWSMLTPSSNHQHRTVSAKIDTALETDVSADATGLNKLVVVVVTLGITPTLLILIALKTATSLPCCC